VSRRFFCQGFLRRPLWGTHLTSLHKAWLEDFGRIGLVDKCNSDWDVKQRGLVMVRTTGIAIFMVPLDETLPTKGLNNTTKVLWKKTST